MGQFGISERNVSFLLFQRMQNICKGGEALVHMSCFPQRSTGCSCHADTFTAISPVRGRLPAPGHLPARSTMCISESVMVPSFRDIALSVILTTKCDRLDFEGRLSAQKHKGTYVCIDISGSFSATLDSLRHERLQQ